MSVARIFRARDLCQTLRGLSAAPPGGCRLGPLLRLYVQNNVEAIRTGIMAMSSIGGAAAKLRPSLDPGRNSPAKPSNSSGLTDVMDPRAPPPGKPASISDFEGVLLGD
jgi:hypothetical protein